jgi:hypothetical protein
MDWHSLYGARDAGAGAIGRFCAPGWHPPPDPALRLCYSMDSSALTGGVLADLSGSGHDGHVHGAPVAVPGVDGEALHFDGTNDWIEADAVVGDVGTADFSVTVWVRTTGLDQPMVNKLPTCQTGSFWYVELNRDGVANFQVDEVAGVAQRGVTGKTLLGDGSFHHVAVVRRGVTVEVYTDGVLEGQAVGTTTERISNTTLLQVATNPCHTLAGTLDEVRFYAAALTAAQVAALVDRSYRCPGGHRCDGMTTIGWPGERACTDRRTVAVCRPSGWDDTGAPCSCP